MNYPHLNRKPTGRVKLSPTITKRELIEAQQVLAKMKQAGLVTVKPPLTEAQIKTEERR